MAEKKPLGITTGQVGELSASDTIPAANVPAISLTAGVSGILPIANGGTNLSALGTSLQIIQVNAGGTALEYTTAPGGGDALTANPLSQFAATTSAQLAGVISDETGSGLLVFDTSPTLVTPVLGVAAATTLNKITVTTPATGATLTIVEGAVLTASATATVSNTNTGDITLAGTPDYITISGQVITRNAIDLTTDTTGDLAVVDGGTGSSTAAGARTNLGVDAAGDLLITAVPGSDHTASGATITLTANEAQAFGDICRIDSVGEATLADASAVGTSGAVVMCVDATIAADAAGTYLMLGIARDDTWAWTIDGLIYLTITGTTTNTLSQTAPTATGEMVQVVGKATHADRMFFNPSLVEVELA